MDLDSYYEITRTAEFIHSRNFTRVALQFPDELLKDSTRVVRDLRDQLRSLKKCGIEQNGVNKDVRLFVMADTTYGSCCVDEVGALHVDANCVVHYGHTCFSPTTTLPAFFVIGKASISVSDCVENMSNCALTNGKSILVLYGLEYAYSVRHIREALPEALRLSEPESKLEVHFADIMSSVMNPSDVQKSSTGLLGTAGDCIDHRTFGVASGNTYRMGGLCWTLPDGHRMEDYLLFWIGSDNSAFANVVMTFNGSDIVRYDAEENCLVTDASQPKRVLMRRYYLVEKAKDANIVGILVGTLGVAGYLHMIHQMKELIARAGKKAYTLVVGRPNPAKLANFPECDVFIYVSCAQTALLDSKEYLAPVITPFEAMLAFNRGSQWTGVYVMEFQDLINSCPVEVNKSEEARFSFLSGGYVEDFDQQEEENGGEDEGALALVSAAQKALQLHDNSKSLIKGTARSGPEYLAARSYQGLDLHYDSSSPEPYLLGRSGRASGYKDEKSRQVEY